VRPNTGIPKVHASVRHCMHMEMHFSVYPAPSLPHLFLSILYTCMYTHMLPRVCGQSPGIKSASRWVTLIQFRESRDQMRWNRSESREGPSTIGNGRAITAIRSGRGKKKGRRRDGELSVRNLALLLIDLSELTSRLCPSSSSPKG